MFKSITMVSVFSCILLLACKSTENNDTAISEARYPGIHQATESIQLDGQMQEAIWNTAEWYPLNQYWIGEKPTAEDFSGRFKLLWNEDHIYVLAEITDDVIRDTHEDGLERYWDDDCLELFIDENNSGGDHQYNHNAFAYHIAQNLRVTDMGTDSLPAYFDSHVQSAKVQQGKLTTWEVGIKVYEDDYRFGSSPRKLMLGEEIGFMVAYCDNDSSPEREHFIGSNFIEGDDKNRGWIDAGVFSDWTLVD